MRIGIEGTATCRPVRTGIARYTIELIKALVEQAEEGSGDEIKVGFRLSRWRRRELCYLPRGVGAFWIQQPFLPLFPGIDLIHGTDGRVPALRGICRTATICDMAIHLFPEFSSQRFREKKMAECRELAALCGKVITISETTRNDFLNFIDYPPEDVVSVPLGVDPKYRLHSTEELESFRASHQLPQKYVLYVGEISRRKNIRNLLAGFAASGLAGEFKLLMVGPRSFGADELLAEIPALGMEKQVELIGFVQDADLPAVYAGASVFLFPTYYEGFGLPVLEAMASGVPVVGGNKGALPEVAGGHAILAEPEDARSIATGLAAALGTTEEERERARKYAGRFTWAACAAATREVYEQALAKR